MAVTIETNEDYEAAALRLGELSRASVESIEHAEFEEISTAMMSFEARRITAGQPSTGEASASEPREP